MNDDVLCIRFRLLLVLFSFSHLLKASSLCFSASVSASPLAAHNQILANFLHRRLDVYSYCGCEKKILPFRHFCTAAPIVGMSAKGWFSLQIEISSLSGAGTNVFLCFSSRMPPPRPKFMENDAHSTGVDISHIFLFSERKFAQPSSKTYHDRLMFTEFASRFRIQNWDFFFQR